MRFPDALHPGIHVQECIGVSGDNGDGDDHDGDGDDGILEYMYKNASEHQVILSMIRCIREGVKNVFFGRSLPNLFTHPRVL